MSKKSRQGTVVSIPTFLFLFFIPTATATPLSFNTSPITRSDGGGFNFSLDAYIDGEGLQLTLNNRSFRLGRATYKEPLHLWDKASGSLTDFSTHFSFVIDSNGNPQYADGLAFFLSPLDPSPEHGYAHGGNLGLGDGTSSDSYIAVEFDTYMNVNDAPEQFSRTLVEFPHVGININNRISVNATPWHNNISMGPQNDAWIRYDATSKMLMVEFTGHNNTLTQRGSLSYKVDLRDHLPEYVSVGFSASTGVNFEQHIIKSWNFSSSLQLNQSFIKNESTDPIPAPSRQSYKKGLIFSVSAGLSLLILASMLAIFVIWKKSKNKKKKDEGLREDHISDSSMDNEFQQGTGPRKFSYNELVSATDDFAEENKLGEGGFGGVYRGFLTSTNTNIAVKRVSKESKQGRKEYAAEVKIISQLRHANLVQLIGWCHQRAELLLVYEFMPNRSLDSHLFKVNSLLTWEMRYKIAQGVASALLYLHEGLRQYVVHRDIKASNIMLDSDFNAKLGDFGLARLVDHDKASQTTIPAGTVGYMAPEYPVTRRASKETDIYSFGIVLLEIACGRRPIDHRCPEEQIVLVEWVWSLYGAGQLLDAADPKLNLSEFDASQLESFMVVGLWCAHPHSSLRPSISQVRQVLYFGAPLLTLPSVMPKANCDLPRVEPSNEKSSNLTTITSAGSTSDFLPR